LHEIRRVCKLVEELRSLRHAPALQHQRLAESLCDLVPARQAVALRFERFVPNDRPALTWMTWAGAATAGEESLLRRWADQGQFREDPMMRICMARQSRTYVATRREMICDQSWYGSPYYQQYLRPARFHDVMGVFFRRCEPGAANALKLRRGVDEKPFTVRERRIMQLFNAELLLLYREGCFDPSAPMLTPRQQQMLNELMSGDTVRNIASRMGISVRTAEEYVQTIYRKYQVRTRSQLMARLHRV